MSQLLVQATAGDVLTEDQCLELGFRRSELQCFRCQDLGRFELSELQDSCLKCCQQKEEKDSARVSSYDRCRLPGRQAFVSTLNPINPFTDLSIRPLTHLFLFDYSNPALILLPLRFRSTHPRCWRSARAIWDTIPKSRVSRWQCSFQRSIFLTTCFVSFAVFFFSPQSQHSSKVTDRKPFPNWQSNMCPDSTRRSNCWTQKAQKWRK